MIEGPIYLPDSEEKSVAYEDRQEIVAAMCERHPALGVCRDAVMDAAELMIRCYSRGGTVLCCGNGGSAADAGHIVGELVKGFKLDRHVRASAAEALQNVDTDLGPRLVSGLQEGLPAIDLAAHGALTTAFANDRDPALVYAQQTYVYGRPDDLLIGLSTSGESANIIAALAVARTMGISTIGMTGRGGGTVTRWSDVAICVPADETAAVQEMHLPVYHTLCEIVEDHFFGGEKDECGV